MNKVKFLSILVGLLIALNIIILGFLLLKKDANRRVERPRMGNENMIPEQFGFDENQLLEFEKTREEHKESSKALNRQLVDVSMKYYNTLATDTMRIAYQSEVLDITKRIYEVNSKHFDDIRSICNEDQLSNMEHFISTLVNKRERRPAHRRKK